MDQKENEPLAKNLVVSPLHSAQIMASNRESQEKPRISKEQLGLLLAMWATMKPDSLLERNRWEKWLLAQIEREANDPQAALRDNVIPPEDTGATLIDSNNMIMSVAGSGHTHAAAFLCNRFPQQVRGGTLCLSKRPCTFCVKMMIQCNVGRIVVPELPSTRAFRSETDTVQIQCFDDLGQYVQESKHVTVIAKDRNKKEVLIKTKGTVFDWKAIVDMDRVEIHQGSKVVQSFTPKNIPTSGREARDMDANAFWEKEPFKTDIKEQLSMEVRWENIRKLLLPSATAFSPLEIPEDVDFNRMSQECAQKINVEALLKDYHNHVKRYAYPVIKASVHTWLSGLCVITSKRSEDEVAKVGALLAKVWPSNLLLDEDSDGVQEDVFNIEVYGVGYNGSKKAALPSDFQFHWDTDKGKWVLHAEQNVFMFRCKNNVSGCVLYTTHSPCIQCSGIIRSMRIKKVFFQREYRYISNSQNRFSKLDQKCSWANYLYNPEKQGRKELSSAEETHETDSNEFVRTSHDEIPTTPIKKNTNN